MTAKEDLESIVQRYAERVGSRAASYEIRKDGQVELARWLGDLASKVLHVIVISEAAAESGAVARLVRNLTDKGVFVYWLHSRSLPSADSSTPKRLVHLLQDPADSKGLLTRLREDGIRPSQIILVGHSEEDPFIPLFAAVRVGLNVDRPLVPPPVLSAPKKQVYVGGGVAFLPADLRGEGDDLTTFLSTLHFGERINVAETAQEIRNGSILDRFSAVAEIAARNQREASRLLKEIAGVDEPRVRRFFDPRSGAICLSPHEWRQAGARSSAIANGRLVPYFQARLQDFWQDDRPCMRRILYTPTKVLLRGEQYYVNMRNASAFWRLESMWGELAESWSPVCGALFEWRPQDDIEWQLLLGFFDQVRSAALQLYLFVHTGPTQIGQFESRFKSLWGNQDARIHGLLSHAVRGYYSCLLRRFDEMQASMQRLLAIISSEGESVRRLLHDCSQCISAAREGKGLHDAPPYPSLVRRWREADHPGENLLVAALASEAAQSDATIHAVGIGWGGIELPLVFDYVCSLRASQQRRLLHVAVWSHYRGPHKNVAWYHFPVHTEDELNLGGNPAILLDDNTLTGTTLERLRDELLLRSAGDIRIYVTRYSGERRHAQMLMERSGAIDPDFLSNHIGGYIAETPFARSWSRAEYTNPIGVFSLSRRRILECIHNNSTVELYQREGF